MYESEGIFHEIQIFLYGAEFFCFRVLKRIALIFHSLNEFVVPDQVLLASDSFSHTLLFVTFKN